MVPPGREPRLAESPFENMRELVEALTLAIRPLLHTPYAFFGHSMGAGIAFELTRSLRRAGAPQPNILIVSRARAPQERTEASRKKEPSDVELAEELAALGSLPQEAFDLTLPILRADSRLYRNYVYQQEPLLAIPIAAYGGDSDSSIAPEQLDRWREQTTGSFIRREFEGGHFYLKFNPDVVLVTLRRDLEPWIER